MKRVLEGIAEDEARHAELAWRFVAWALERGGRELQELARAEFERCLTSAPAPASGGAVELERHGVLSPRSSHELRQRALADVVLPCARALLERSQNQAPGVLASRPSPAQVIETTAPSAGARPLSA